MAILFLKESTREWNCTLTCFKVVRELTLLVWTRSFVSLRTKVRVSCPRYLWAASTWGISGGPWSSLDAGDAVLGASVNSSVPRMAMRIEAGGNVKCSGFHSCCHQNKNDLTVFWAPRQHWNDMPPTDLIHFISGTRIARAICSICSWLFTLKQLRLESSVRNHRLHLPRIKTLEMESYPFIGRSRLNMVYFTSETDFAFRELLFAVVP